METPQIISIIDDEAAIRRATGGLLRSLGFQVNAFVSAEDFLRSDCAEKCVCIISDVHMPGMSGIDLFELLRSRGIPTPFIFITAFSEQSVRQRVGDDVCVLQKPFKADILIDCIERGGSLNPG